MFDKRTYDIESVIEELKTENIRYFLATNEDVLTDEQINFLTEKICE